MLTPDQQVAKKKFLKFLLGNQTFFYLFGAAGCGKTYLLQHLLTDGLEEYENTCKLMGELPISYEIWMTATTNKALEALEQHAPKTDRLQGIKTVFSLYGVTVKNNFRTGDSDLDFGKAVCRSSELIVIDECSMLPKEMLEHIQNNSPNCKIVFVGDNFQLAPVNESPYWEKTPEDRTAVLTTPVRNQNSRALKNLCDQLRDTVNTLEFQPIQLCDGSIELLDDEQALDWLKNTDYSRNRVLCYTNNKALKYIRLVENLLGTETLIRENLLYVNNNGIWNAGKKISFFPEEVLKLEEIHKEPYIEMAPNPAFWVTCVQGRVSSLRNPHKSCDVVIATNPEEFKECLRKCAAKKDWESYFFLKNRVLDLRLPYASTIHKAQGSTFDEVLIDLGSFVSCRDPETAARLLYVAVSRARNKVLFYGKLPKSYGVLV